MLRYLTAGESHGPGLVVIVEGMPSGVPVTAEAVNRQLARRQEGYGRGGRMKIERDRASFMGGVRQGETTGAPVAMLIENRDWANWTEVMGAEPLEGGPGSNPASRDKAVRFPRPGHADLTGVLKYDRRDARDILERASARETAARVAAGSVARCLLEAFGVIIAGQVVSIGSVRAAADLGIELSALADRAEASPVRCADPEASAGMVAEIDAARSRGDSLGGVFEVAAAGLPPGLGSHVAWDRKLDGRLAAALMSLQSVKGVEVGLGFEAACRPGSEVHDEIAYEPDRGFFRLTNRAGGLEGGMTNGEPLVVRAAMKPIATLYRPLRTVDLASRQSHQATVERSDACAVPAGAVIGEALVAFELAAAWMEKFGGDSLGETRRNYESYLEQVARY